MKISYCRTGHARALRTEYIKRQGSEKAALATDEMICQYFEDEGYSTWVSYEENDFETDDILVMDISTRDFFIITRNGKVRYNYNDHD